jgi:hypothetical protein
MEGTRLSHDARERIRSVSPRVPTEDFAVEGALDTLLDYADLHPAEVLLSPKRDIRDVFQEDCDHTRVAALLEETKTWLTHFLYSALFRAAFLAEEVCLGFNERRYGRIFFSTRALTELLALVIWYYRQIHNLHTEARIATGDDPMKALKSEFDLRDVLVVHSRATRLNWDDAFGSQWSEVRSEIQQKNILTMMDKLPGEHGPRLKQWYAQLSDVCHPNFGSLLMITDFEKTTVEPFRVGLVRRPGGNGHLEVTLDLCGPALTFCCHRLQDFLKAIESAVESRNHAIQHFSAIATAGRAG